MIRLAAGFLILALVAALFGAGNVEVLATKAAIVLFVSRPGPAGVQLHRPGWHAAGSVMPMTIARAMSIRFCAGDAEHRETFARLILAADPRAMEDEMLKVMPDTAQSIEIGWIADEPDAPKATPFRTH